MLADGAITLDQWQGSVREAIKAAHLQATIIGHGGRSGMGSAEYGRVGQRLRQEYAYLQGFARDLLDQRISGPMAAARIGLYAQSVRGSFWEGASIRKEQQGLRTDAAHSRPIGPTLQRLTALPMRPEA
jgi:hypothetical protein